MDIFFWYISPHLGALQAWCKWSMHMSYKRLVLCNKKYAYVVQAPSALQQGLVPRIKQASSSTKVFNYKNMQAQRTIIVKHLATQHLCVVCGVCVSCPRPTSLSRQCPHPCCRSVGQRVTRSLSRANSIHAWTICPWYISPHLGALQAWSKMKYACVVQASSALQRAVCICGASA